MIRGLEDLSYGDRLREFSLQKQPPPNGGYKRAGEGQFIGVCSDRTKGMALN